MTIESKGEGDGGRAARRAIKILVVEDEAVIARDLRNTLQDLGYTVPVPVGSRIRLTATLVDVEEVKGGLQLTVGGVIEREGSDKPVCVLESLSRLFG